MSFTPAEIWTGIVIGIHGLIAVAEGFFWPKLTGTHGRLGLPPDCASRVTPIVRNAGLYNAFLAVGLGVALGAGADGRSAQQIGLGFAAVAGVVGAVTLSRWTLLVQTVPAAVALWLLRAG